MNHNLSSTKTAHATKSTQKNDRKYAKVHVALSIVYTVWPPISNRKVFFIESQSYCHFRVNMWGVILATQTIFWEISREISQFLQHFSRTGEKKRTFSSVFFRTDSVVYGVFVFFRNLTASGKDVREKSD